MANNITYKVLWIDDQVAFDPDFVEGYQIKAEAYDIDLCPVSNWQDARKLLYDNS